MHLKVPNDRFRVRQCVDRCDATEERDEGEDQVAIAEIGDTSCEANYGQSRTRTVRDIPPLSGRWPQRFRGAVYTARHEGGFGWAANDVW